MATVDELLAGAGPPDYVAIQAEFPGRVHSTIEIAAHAGGIANHALLFGSNATDHTDPALAVRTAAGLAEDVGAVGE